MATQLSATLRALLRENPQSQFGFAVGQLPNVLGIAGIDPGGLATTQLVFPNVLTYRISRTQDQTSDTCTLTFADDQAKYLSTNRFGTRGKFWYPGPINKTIGFYLGYKGPINSGKPNFQDYVIDSALQFTGYVETDASAQSTFTLDKTVTLNDLTSQFKFQVYDTFPHALFGDQTLSYFDPTYNLTPIGNPNNNGQVDGVVWQCDGRMFTTSSNDPVWGPTNMAIECFVDTTGNTPQNTSCGTASVPQFPDKIGHCTNYSFDYADGTVTFTNTFLNNKGFSGGLPLHSNISLQGNPTYMAPEVMIRKLLVEKAGWNEDNIDLLPTNLLLPMFDGQDRSIWDCLTSITAMTSPRFTPWKFWCDETGNLHLYETNLDGPPVRYWINGQNVITANHEYTARDIRTVVRGDGTVAIAGTDGFDSGSDQAITSIVYDNKAIAEYGLTEPLLLSSDITDSIRHLSPTQAVAHLNLIAQSVLYQNTRPVYTITVDGIPDPALQIGDKIHYTDDNIGVDDEFEITGIEKASDGKVATMQTTLQQYYETINMNLGVPAGVSDDPTGKGATQAPPNSAIFSAVKMGTNAPVYVYKEGDYVRDQNNNPIFPVWSANDSTDGMHFDYQLWAKAKAEGNHNPWNYHNLPPLSSPWEAEQAHDGDTVYYVPKNSSDGYTYYVGPDSIFYRYSNGPPKNDPPNGGNSDYHTSPADVVPQYEWVPPGNQDDHGDRTGKGYNVWVWAWWYLCLNSNIVDGGTGNPYWSEPFKEKQGRMLMRLSPFGENGDSNIAHIDAKKITVPDNSSVWVLNTWKSQGVNMYPGPNYNFGGVTKLYKNLVIGCSDYTKPPPGFIGANVMGDGVNVGVAYGADAGPNALYINYQKKTKGHFNLFAMDSDGGSQFLRIPFWLQL